MDNDKKPSPMLPKIKLRGAKIRMLPQIKLRGESAAKDGSRDRLQRPAESAGS